MPSPYIVGLSEAAGLANLGQKALGLRWLMDQGVMVPATYVCPSQALDQLESKNEAESAALRRALGEIIAPERRYAIRSAANLEDGEEASFAGQFSTSLNVQGPDNVLAAVAETYASRNGSSVQAYASKKQIDTRQVKMAVMIQEMVDPVFSGVAFSRNPITGLDETVIEAVNGSGNTLLQDGATPLRWVNKWGSWTVRPEETALGGQGVPGAEVVEELVRETRRLANNYGRPVDLEWVYDGGAIHWLQIRPITRLDEVNIYSNRIAREVLPGIIKPLVWSVNIPCVNGAWCDLFGELIGPNDIDPDSLAKAFFHRAYFNMSTIGQVLTAVGMPKESLELMMGLEGGADRPRFRPGAKVLPHLPRMVRFFIDKLRFARRVAGFLPAIKEAYASFDLEAVRELDDGALLSQIERLGELYREIAYYNIVVPLLARAYDSLLRRRLAASDIAPEAFDLMDGIDELQDYQPHTHLARLHADFAALDSRTRRQIREGDYEFFCALPGIEAFQQDVQTFIDRFGHLSDSGNDFSYAPWREDKDFVLNLIVNYVDSHGVMHRAKRDDLNLGPASQLFFDLVYHRARQFHLYREAISSQYTYGYGLFRAYFLEIGRRFVERDLILEEEDVFYLYLDEVLAALRNGKTAPSLEAKVARRQATIKTTRDFVLPDIIYGEQPPPLESFDESQMRLAGVPTSRGYYRGPVKVIKSVTEFEGLKEGDVLVIPHSDVAWTPLFARAGAVVAESGGMLSHSSIVAREYGLPAVVSVSDACRIPDGTVVTVDGVAGLVFLETGPADEGD